MENNGESDFELMARKQKELMMYKAGFNVLMEYWDSLPDEEKPKIDARLKRIGL